MNRWNPPSKKKLGKIDSLKSTWIIALSIFIISLTAWENEDDCAEHDTTYT